MPIKIPNDLPASKILREENIFVMDEKNIYISGGNENEKE